MKRIVYLILILVLAGCSNNLCREYEKGYERNDCLFEIKTEQACDEMVVFDILNSGQVIGNPELVGSCYQRLYNKSNDETFCHKMAERRVDREHIESCFKNEGYSQDEICEFLGVASLHYEYRCYEELAVQRKDISLCKDARTYYDDQEYRCIILVAMARNESMLCEMIPLHINYCTGDFIYEEPGHRKNCILLRDECIRNVNAGKWIS